MIRDKFGNLIYQEQDLVDLLYKGVLSFETLTVEDSSEILEFCAVSGIKLSTSSADKFSNVSIEEFDKACQNDWFIPDDYKTFDIRGFCIENSNPTAIARINEELTAFETMGLFDMLRTLKYLVDVLRKHNIVWGVGRGSSVASYVLYLLGVHRIDSIKYNLDWREFLR